MDIQFTTLKRYNYRLLFSLGSFAILFYDLDILTFNHYLANGIYNGILWRMGLPAMFGIYLAFRKLRDGTEMRILIAFWVWIIIVYFVNGDRTLSRYADYYIDMSGMILMFAPGILLRKKIRERFFEGCAWLITLTYFILSLICVYCAVKQTSFLNPIDQYGIGYNVYSGMGRITVFSAHPNITAGHFFISLSMSLWLILHRKNVFLRFFLGINAFLSFVTIALTVSRNGQTIAAIAVSLFVGILVLERMKERPMPTRLIALALCFLLITFAAYMMNEPIRYTIWKMHENSAGYVEPSETAINSMPASAMPLSATRLLSSGEEFRSDDRGYFESGRKEIFWSAIKSLEMEPKRLLIGSSGSDVMRISNQLIKEQAAHFHNVFLQVINEYGLIGLGLVIGFFMLMIHHGVIMILSADDLFLPDEKMIVVPVFCLLLYYQLECGIFTNLDYRVTFFFLSCGVLTGCYRDKAQLLTQNC